MSETSFRELRRHDEWQVVQWKALLAKADGGTIFHDPDFLAYPRDRFEEHHLGYFRGDTLYGILPMAISEQDGVRTARSPYCGSVGGFVFPAPLDYSRSDELMAGLVCYLRDLGISRVVITPPVPAYYRLPTDTLLFAMLRNGFRPTNSEITSILPLGPAVEADAFTSRARNMARKAEKAGVTCRLRAAIEDFWPLMEMTFDKHGARPTHSRAQWAWLMEHLPGSVWVDVAYVDGRPAAGIGHFRLNALADSSFYLCHDPTLRDSQASTLLVCHALVDAAARGYHWFDFGGSSVNMEPRENVFRFKESFGAVGMFRHSYSADLS